MKFPRNYFPSQPRSVWALSALEACEAFSFYGLGSILMLFMKRELGYSDSHAIGVYALYMAMMEVFSLVGGILADRLFGLKKCVVIGAYIMLIGYILVALLPYNLFYLGIGFIVMGSGLFASNSSTLLGLCYKGPNDPRRNRGFTLYYVGLNLGAFLSFIACGLLGEKLNWGYGFLIAASGMLVGVLILISSYKILPDKAINISFSARINRLVIMIAISAPFIFAFSLYYAHITAYIMPFVFIGSIAYLLKEWFYCSKEQRKNILNIIILTLILILFFAAEEQIRSSFVLFADRHVHTSILGWSIPVSSLTAINPLVVVLISPFILLNLGEKNPYKEGVKKITMGLFIISVCFAYLLYISSNTLSISIYQLFFVLAGIALSEMFIGPVVYSLCTILSPSHLKGSMMGLVTIGYGVANHLAGYLANMMSVPADFLPQASIGIYRGGFKMIFVILLLATISTFFWRKFFLEKQYPKKPHQDLFLSGAEADAL